MCAALLAACRPEAVERPAVAAPTPAISTPFALTFLTVKPTTQIIPAGASAQFALNTDPTRDLAHYFYGCGTPDLPPGITVDFLGNPTPYANTLVVHTSGTLIPGAYPITVWVKAEEGPPVSAQLTLHVTVCTEFEPGERTQAVSSNLVYIQTAGKPSFAHGLLVPLQVCGNDQNRPIRVVLKTVMSEAGTLMASPPPFYLYRSLVWPEPPQIQAHNSFSINVDVDRIGIGRLQNDNWELQGEVRAGLYLLVFERDYYRSSTAPQDIPASVTYQVEIGP